MGHWTRSGEEGKERGRKKSIKKGEKGTHLAREKDQLACLRKSGASARKKERKNSSTSARRTLSRPARENPGAPDPRRFGAWEGRKREKREFHCPQSGGGHSRFAKLRRKWGGEIRYYGLNLAEEKQAKKEKGRVPFI